MPVGLEPVTHMPVIDGIEVGVAASGERYRGRTDMALFLCDDETRAAALFTRNAFRAAPVTVAGEHLAGASPRALLVNAGNANAGTGPSGIVAAKACCDAVAGIVRCAAEAVVPFSTGVIGEPIDVSAIARAVPTAFASRRADGWLDAARAIMTTDTQPKGVSITGHIEGKPFTVNGIAKGAGMIRPDMATMLAFLATDLAVETGVLDAALHRAVERSFNRITIDGDTSTNDSCIVLATGRSRCPVVTRLDSPAGQALQQAISEVCHGLAMAIVRDAEGITKFITIQVEQGATAAECLAVAYAIAHSPLVKTAFFASDPNWGRILAAIGRAGVRDMNLGAVKLFLGDVCIVSAGGRDPGYDEQAGQNVMAQEEIAITVQLGRGEFCETVWTTDLSHDYVRINAEYRS